MSDWLGFVLQCAALLLVAVLVISTVETILHYRSKP